jgi:hypothetical protein
MLARLPDFRLSLLGKELTPASSVRDLRVKFDPILSFNNHILSTVSSCKSGLCQINRAKHVFRKNLLITVINALVFLASCTTVPRFGQILPAATYPDFKESRTSQHE